LNVWYLRIDTRKKFANNHLSPFTGDKWGSIFCFCCGIRQRQ
jgi:hypothetical protein